MADKRKTGRIIKRLQAKLLCDGEERSGISSNFSLTGLFIKSRKKFKPGTHVNITLDLGNNQKISLRGEIVRIKSSDNTSIFDKFSQGMGIKLNDTPQEYIEFLKVLTKEQL